MRQHCRAIQSITAAYNQDGNVIFYQEGVSAKVVSKWATVFKGQTEPVFPDHNEPDLPDLDSSDPILSGLPKSAPNKHEDFLCRPFTLSSLNERLSSLKDNKSSGIDNIPTEAIKYGGETLLSYLLIFYNLIWKTGYVPECLNAVKCVLIPKSGDTLEMLNYCPIAVSSCLLRRITKRLAEDMSHIAEREGLLGQ